MKACYLKINYTQLQRQEYVKYKIFETHDDGTCQCMPMAIGLYKKIILNIYNPSERKFVYSCD